VSGETDARTEERGTIRLALVMNGGVSLAVWMGGVTHELDLLRRASTAGVPETDVAERDLPVFRIWRDLAREKQREVEIDILSGTSAGGLNGLFLATAIARGGRLPDLRQMWRSSASLDKLLKQPMKLRHGLMRIPLEQNSVLNGVYFEKKIGEALESIRNGSDRKKMVTLFVTATALDGRSRTYRDSYGRVFSVPDHRRVYRFESHARDVEYARGEDGGYEIVARDKEEDHFADEAEQVLRLAGRVTAGFPGAFPPVSESPLLDRRIIPDDGRSYPASSVMDGGVLNNEPFGSVLEAITKRVASGAVERVVAYVVPSGGQVAEEAVKDQRSRDVSIGTTLWSATNYPKEANFRASVDELDSRLATSGLATRDELFERLIAGVCVSSSGADGAGSGCGGCADEEFAGRMAEAATGLLGEYRRSRLTALLLALRPAAGTDTDAVTTLSAPELPNHEAFDAVLARTEWLWCPSADPAEIEDPEWNGRESWRWGLIVAERLVQLLENHLQTRLAPGSGRRSRGERPRGREALSEAARFIDQQLREVIAITDAVKAEELRRRRSGAELSEEQVARLVDGVFRDLEVNRAAGVRVWQAAEKFASALNAADPAGGAGDGGYGSDGSDGSDGGGFWDARKVVSTGLQVEVLTQTFAPPAQVLGKLTPRFRFLRLGPDSVGPLFNEDWSEDLGDRKLYGIRFRHFGAFINDDWRKSDFLWGRLDAVHHLLPLLMPHCDVMGREKALHRAILEAETGLPSEKAVAGIRDRLAQLKHSTDAELLNKNDGATVKAAGDSVLRRATKGQGRLVRQVAYSVWAYVWEAWSQGGSAHDVKLGHAVTKPFRRMARGAIAAYLALLAGIAAVIVLVVVH
jgi:predicted acylesterase/phospholipase RssA